MNRWFNNIRRGNKGASAKADTSDESKEADIADDIVTYSNDFPYSQSLKVEDQYAFSSDLVLSSSSCSHSMQFQLSLTKKGKTKRAVEKFPLLYLSDDLIIYILSFASYAPFETDVLMVAHKKSHQEVESSSSYTPMMEYELKHLTKDYNSKTNEINKFLYRKSRKSRNNNRKSGNKSQSSRVLERNLICQSYGTGMDRYGYGSTISSTRPSRFSPSSFHRIDQRKIGTLTHVFPLINKRLRMICQRKCPLSRVLWIEALERIVRMDSSGVWKKGLLNTVQSLEKNRIPQHESGVMVEQTADVATDATADFILERAHDCVQTCHLKEDEGFVEHHELLFRKMYSNKPERLPVFEMRFTVRLGEMISLFLDEPRYKEMIQELMANRSIGEKYSCLPLNSPRPRFLFSCFQNIYQRGAYVVEIYNCHIHKNDSANVTVIPRSWTMLENIMTRPESNGLLEATIS